MKKILLRAALGAPIGLAICTLITVVISLFLGTGAYSPVPPQLVADCGNELRAVLLQTACALLYGAAFGGASVIWQKEEWNLLRQTATHFLVISVCSFPIAYFMYWIPHDWRGMLCYCGLFVAVYALIWLFAFVSIRRKVKKLNEKIKNENQNDDPPRP